MAVHYTTEGPIAVITIDRPEVRNAVDRATAGELAAAFRAFDADEALSVAILTGASGTFCAGADLKAVATGGGNRTASERRRPNGTDADAPLEAGNRRRGRFRRCRRT